LKMCYYLGLDLGQVQDYTALAVLERPIVTVHTPRCERCPAYALRHLRRYPLGTPYPEVVQDVIKLLRTPHLQGCLLAVDQTGVGRAVVDMFRDSMQRKVTCRFAPITITGGHAVTAGTGTGIHVPKKELVGAVQVLLQSRRLHIARGLPESSILVKELEHFRVKITVARNEMFEAWRENAHDDLVLAVALAAWCGEKVLPALDAVPERSYHTSIHMPPWRY
jgi:hypothetical protein